VVVLGGDGTMLRALRMYLGTGVPVLGVNFGRVGFLSSMQPDQLEEGLARAFSGDFVTVELPTLEVEVESAAAKGEATDVAVNDVVVTSGELGRMVELEWAVGGEDLGLVPCDGIICSTPSGSTAYNLSNGGPVLMWGIDAMAITFVAPHALDVRPFVAPRGRDLIVWNRTPDVPVAVLVDGHRLADAPPGGRALVRLGPERTLLATLPEATFVRRYRTSFAP
jgi:NAD+ kinase